MNINHNFSEKNNPIKYYRPSLNVIIGGKYKKEEQRKEKFRKFGIFFLYLLFNSLISIILFFYVRIILKF